MRDQNFQRDMEAFERANGVHLHNTGDTLRIISTDTDHVQTARDILTRNGYTITGQEEDRRFTPATRIRYW